MRVFLASVLFLISHLTFAGSLDPAGGARTFSLDLLENECIEFANVKVGHNETGAGDCRVSEFGVLGTMGGREYYYALYCLIPSWSMANGDCGSGSANARYHRARALAIFVEDAFPGSARLWIERASPDIGVFVYERPEIVRNAIGTFLYVPIRPDGTGTVNESEYYLWQNAQWQRVDGQSWFDPVAVSIAPGRMGALRESDR